MITNTTQHNNRQHANEDENGTLLGLFVVSCQSWLGNWRKFCDLGLVGFGRVAGAACAEYMLGDRVKAICVYQAKRMIGGIGNVLFWTHSQTLNGPVVTSFEPLVQVITPRGPFLVSRKLTIRDEPNIRLRCSRIVHFLHVFSMKNAEVLSGETMFHRIGPTSLEFIFQGWKSSDFISRERGELRVYFPRKGKFRV